MITVASRPFLGLAAFGLLAGGAYMASAGDRTGTILLLVLAVGALVAGLALNGRRDREAELEMATTAATAATAATSAPGRVELDPVAGPGSSVWPLGGAIGVGVAAVGSVAGAEYAAIGFGVLLLVALGWYGQTWRAANPESYGVLRGRLFVPILVPILAFLGVGLLVVPASRILLAVSKDASVVIAIVLATVILVVASLLATRPQLLRSGAVTGLLLLSGLGLIAGGIVAAAAGEREFAEHAAEEGHGEGGAEGEGAGEREGGHGDDAIQEPDDPVVELVDVSARGLEFDTDTITVPAQSEVVVRFENEDQAIPHNVAVYESRGGAPIFVGETFAGRERRDYEFTSPAPGTYYFQCDVHPNMSGDFVAE